MELWDLDLYAVACCGGSGSMQRQLYEPLFVDGDDHLLQIIDDDDALSSVCLTEQRNAMASIIGDGGDIWSGPGHMMAVAAAATPPLGGSGLPLHLGGTLPPNPALPRVPAHALRQADRMLQV